MGKGLARQGDPETCCFCPKPPYCPIGTLQIMNCSRTFINGRIAAVVGDGIICCAVAIATGGSSTVFIENRPAHRLGDANSCGYCIGASHDTIVG